jgi:hypothetical protein
MSDHIVVGDAHAKPEVSNRRFDWLGKFILDYKLEHKDNNVTVIDMGDWEDMPSLSSYDIGKKSYEGRRYRLDIQAAHDARLRVNQPIDAFNAKAARNHERRLFVRKVALGGNHFERRVERAVENSAMLDGVISVADNHCAEFGWEYSPFLTPINIDGIAYVHYWQGRGTSQPIGMGKFSAAVLLREKHTSTITGHNHVLDFATALNGNGKRVLGISAGCYLDPDQFESYAGQNNDNWWRGIIVLKDVVDGWPNGGFDIIPIEELQRKYG